MAKKGTAKKKEQKEIEQEPSELKETADEDELKTLIGTQIRRIRQTFFNSSQEKLGDQIFGAYGQNIMFRLEKGNGSAIHVFKILQFFHQQGINLNFIFEADLNDISILKFNLNSQDTVFIQSIVKRYEATMENLLKLKDLNALAIDKNINDMRTHIESISTLTTMESIDIKNNEEI